MAEQLSDEVLAAVVELQRVELNRLLNEKRRLNDETSRMLQIIEREQILRQKMQDQIGELREHLALPSPETRRLERRLGETESNFDLLKQAMWKLVIFLEGKQV